MKKALFLLALLGIFALPLTAQEFRGLDKSPADIAAFPAKYNVSDKMVRVVYSRPQLKDRDVADLAPAGKVWRTGANEAVEITFYKAAKVGNQNIAAGTYSLFTIPGEEEWTVILNKNLNQWGAYSYDSAADVARITAKASSADESLEAFSIAFKEVDGGAHMVMGWGNVRVATAMTF